MAKQRLESYLSRSLKKHRDVWWMKIQVNQLAHTPTPADYIILSKNMRYLVEAKECNNRRFDFSRLTQESALKIFVDIHDCNEAYILLMFWCGNVKKSYIYLIEIDKFLEYKHRTDKKSINLIECEEYFANDRLNVNKTIIDLSRLV